MTSAAPPPVRANPAISPANPSAASGRSRTSPERPAMASPRSGSRKSPKESPPSGPSPTRRSHQPRSARTNWRTGSASKNSFATTIAGPAGACDSRSCQAIGTALPSNPRGAQEVPHQRAASRAELDERERARVAHKPPGLDRPKADELAEHLADLRRRDEIARRAERIAPRVVAMHRMPEAERHVALDRDRAVGGDHPAQLVLEAGHAEEASTALGRRGRVTPRSARAIAVAPTSAIGSDSSIPMVMPPPSASTEAPKRKPSWGSGSRKNSQTMRATA